jgi:hypothetical protein
MKKNLNRTYEKLKKNIEKNSKQIFKKSDYVYLATGKLFLEIIENMPPQIKTK